jgi:hypothetical protein
MQYHRKRKKNTIKFQEKLKRNQANKKAKYIKKPKLSKGESENRLKLRRSIHKIFKRWGINKLNKSYDYLGFTKEEFFEKFPVIPNGVEIDHKIPISWFKRETPIYIIFHIENLQLLPKAENRAKSNYRNDIVNNSYLELAKPFIREEFILRLNY